MSNGVRRVLRLLPSLLVFLGFWMYVMLCGAQTAHYAGVQTPLAAGLNAPGGVAVDSQNNFYIVDTGNNRLLKETPSGSGYVQTVLTDTNISSPSAAAVDAAGNLYIVNSGSSKNLVKLTLSGNSYTSSVISSSVGSPTGVAVTQDGTALYVASPSNGSVYQFAYASGSYIQQATVTSGFSAGIIPNLPTGLATDSTGAWYVLSNGQVFRHAAGFSSSAFNGTIAVSGFSLAANAVAVDSAGIFYVVDTGNSQLVTAPSGSTTLTVLASNVSSPKGVAVDAKGNIAVVDTGNNLAFVQNPAAPNFGPVAAGTTSAALTLAFVFDTAGNLNGSAPYQALLQGAGNLDYAVVAGPGTTCTAGAGFGVNATCTVSATFTPRSLGQRYGAVVLNGSAGARAALAYVAGTGAGPQVAFAPVQTTLFSGLTSSWGMAVDGTGNVYICDSYSNRVVKETLAAGVYTQSSIGSGLYGPSSVAVDGAGNVYIADTNNNRVLKETLAGNAYAQSSIAGGLSTPYGVAVDGAGNVYITDAGNGRVLKETLAGGAYTQSSITGGVFGTGIAVDAAGNVYVADVTNNRGLKLTVAAGAYTPSSIGSGLNSPFGIALDAAGNVYIADTNNARVLKETLSGGVYAQSSIGSGLSQPFGVAVDSAGNVYITQTTTITVETVTAPPSLSFAATAVGTTSSDSPQKVVVANNGNLPLAISAVSGVAPNFSLDASACLASALPVNGSCSLSYSYTPTFIGAKTAASSLSDNSLNAAAVQTVQLNGAAATPGSQTITFPQPTAGGNFLPGTVVPLNATASSGLPVNYSVILAKATGTFKASLQNGNSILISGSGSGIVTITASQDGSTNYSKAASVTDTFAVMTVAAPPSGASLPDTAISSSSTANISVQVLTSGTLSSVTGLPQAAAGQEYSASLTASNCAAGGSLVPGQVCSATATFTPKYAGPRYGAVELLDANGNILGTTLLQANGLGPQVAFAPVQSSLVSTGLVHPVGVAVDGAGNLYIADSANGLVLKETLSGGVYIQSSIGSGLYLPFGVAVDGAGNVYIANSGNANVLKETLSGGAYTQSTIGSGLSRPYGVAVDGAGNVYIADASKSYVLKETLAGGAYTQSNIGSGLGGPSGVAVDGAGDVYVVAPGSSSVVKETLSAGAYTQTSFGSGLVDPLGVAVDGAGNVYVADTFNGYLVTETLSGGSYVQGSVGSGLNLPSGVAVDGAGNLYIGDSGDARVVLESVSLQPTITFGSTATGVTSAPRSTTITNLGNQPLVFSVPANGSNPQTAANFLLETNADTTCPVVNAGGAAGQLAADTTCTLSYVFAPTQPGGLSSTSVLNDNNLNVTGAFQTITLQGSATQGTKTAQTITFPQPAALYPGGAMLAATASSGLAVSYTLLNGPATLSGSLLTYTGTGTVTVTASQAGNTQYAAAVSVTISFNVVQAPKAVPTITWATPAAVPYGTLLSATQLNATSPVPGTFTYFPSAGILSAGANLLSVLFTPADTTTYATATAQVTLQVNPARPAITWATPAAVLYGTALSGTQLNATSPIPGSFSYNPSTGVLPAGPHLLSVTFTPADATDYTTATAQVTLQVNQATPTITTPPTAAAITYGQTLANATLSGGSASTAGAFAFTTAATAPNAGTTVYSVTFTPQDAVDYISTTTSVSVTTNKATPAVLSPPTSTSIAYGQTLASSALSGGSASTAGTFAFANPAVAPGTGTAAYSVIFTPQDAADYTVATTSVSVTTTASALSVGLVSSLNPALAQGPIVFTATFSSPAGAPAGQVTFLDGAAPLGTAPLVGGSAQLIVTTLGVGTHNIVAGYAGSANFAPASSAVLTQTVADFVLNSSGSVLSQSVLPGAVATYTLTVSPSGTAAFPASIAFSLSGLPTGSAYTLTPSTIAAGSGATNIVITVTAPLQTAANAHSLPPVTLALLLLPLAAGLRRRRTFGRHVLVLLLGCGSTAVLAGMSGCAANTGVFAQPPNSYTLVLTGVSGATVHATSLNLTVQ